jgi:hypothetical protein
MGFILIMMINHIKVAKPTIIKKGDCHPKEFEAELIAPCKLIGNPRHTVSSMPALGCGGDSTVIVKTAVSRKTDDVAEAG